MKISTEELNELLQKEFERGRQSAIGELQKGAPIEDTTIPFKPYNLCDYITTSHCKTCPNHPSNGGSGICNCILGLQPITYSTTTTFK